MKTRYKIIIVGIVLTTIVFGTHQSLMHQCGTLPVFMETPRNPNLWNCLEIWEKQSKQYPSPINLSDEKVDIKFNSSSAIVPSNIESERKILECYGIFNCNVSSQYFESCIDAKKNGVTIEQLCLDSDITIDNGCATIVFPDSTKTVSCHYDNYKIDCNGIDGKKELECFSEAFESCDEATMNFIIYTIEGDPGYFEGSVEGGDSCYVGVIFDNSEDRFSHPDDRIVTETRCTSIEFTKHTMNIGDCDDSFDYQLNYQSPDWASDEKCRSIDGEWNYEFHNCVVIDDSISLCEENDGTIACMFDEQKETLRDICLPVCEFEVVDRK
jgi:hypothetical protein